MLGETRLEETRLAETRLGETEFRGTSAHPGLWGGPDFLGAAVVPHGGLN